MLKSNFLRYTLLAALVFSGPAAIAAGSLDPPSPAPSRPEDPDVAAGRQAVEAKNWQAAIEAFGKVVAKEPGKASGYNMLAYSYRKSGNLDLAFKNYNEALRLDPKHRPAHEYIGEAYLMIGNLQKAEEHLKVLDQLCLFGCEEYTDLKKAVAEYRQKAANK
jgi:Flp pilus assembly protein TadD